jgi:hypothetical protein
MAFLLDTNTLIQAKNDYYAFGLCPGFWDWLATANAAGTVYSIEPVLREIRDGNDDLTSWANDQPPEFFLSVDTATAAKLPHVIQWVQSVDFREEAKREFLARADPILIAYALAHGCSLVTHEVHIQGEKRKVKIPTVCRGLGVDCVRTFQMLSSENVRFVLE